MSIDIQVIGGAGMLGRCVVREGRARGYTVVDDTLDVTRVAPLDVRCPIVINCAAITDRGAPQWKAVAVNAIGPHVLASACATTRSRVVQISSDMVFSSPGPHTEEDPTDAVTFPALLKLFGEIKGPPHVTIRTSIVGIGTRGLVGDVMNATSRHPVIASNNLQWSGVTAQYFAGVLLDVAVREDIVGLLHVPGQFTTRWRLCSDIAEWLGFNDGRIRRDDSFVADRRLVSVRWEKLGLPPVPSVMDQLKSMERPG